MVKVHTTEHFVRSAEASEQSRGLEAGWLWVDEAAYVKQHALDIFLGRIRYPGGSLKKRFTTTPAGYNDFYHRHHSSGDNYDPSRKLILAKTEDNYFLPEGYVESLRRSYSSKLALQEIDGEFLSLAGLACYYEFDRKKHSEPIHHLFTNSPKQQLYVFMDVNIDPMAGVVGYMEDDKVFIIDEVFIEGGCDIRALGTHIQAEWGQYDPIIVFDGTAGNKRSIYNIKETANKIIRTMGMRTQTMVNPLVVKRLAHTNATIYHGKVLIDSNNCGNLIRDLEQVQYGKNSNEIDKTSNKLLTHVSDGFSYMLWKLLNGANVQKQKTIFF